MSDKFSFKKGEKVRYVGESKEIQMKKGDIGTIVELGDIPAKVSKDDTLTTRPLIYDVLPEESGKNIQLLYYNEIEPV